VGLYAVTANAVGQRRRELALRMALGARTSHVRRIVLQRAAWQVGLGLVLGIICTSIWDAVLFTGKIDARFAAPDVLLPVSGVLMMVMLTASLAPAERATRLPPAAILKRE
jgi:ABC-type antimicrobial peptide transport system permease subunit